MCVFNKNHSSGKSLLIVADKDTVYLRPLVSDFLSFCVSWGPHYTTNGRQRVTLKYLNYVTATLGTGLGSGSVGAGWLVVKQG